MASGIPSPRTPTRPTTASAVTLGPVPPHAESQLTASGPTPESDLQFGPQDALANPFGGYGENPAPPGTSLIPGYPSASAVPWDARSVATTTSTVPAESVEGTVRSEGSLGKTIRKKFSKVFSKKSSSAGPSSPVKPASPILGSSVAQSVFSSFVSSGPSAGLMHWRPEEKTSELVATKFGDRGPPAGKRTSALASTSAAGEGKRTGKGKMPVGVPELTEVDFLTTRVGILEDAVSGLMEKLDRVVAAHAKEREQNAQDREALNKIIATLRAQLQDAVGAEFRVPVPDLPAPLPVAPVTPRPAAAHTTEPQGQVSLRKRRY